MDLINYIAAEIRTVILRPLPHNATPKFITSIVFGGPLEQIHMRSDDSACVRFLHGADCQTFYKATAKGIVYGKDKQGRDQCLKVTLGRDVDVVGGKLAEWIARGNTRCVKATYVDKDLQLARLRDFAAERKRVLDDVEDFEHEKGVSTFHLSLQDLSSP